jgi:hypothetical protein
MLFSYLFLLKQDLRHFEYDHYTKNISIEVLFGCVSSPFIKASTMGHDGAILEAPSSMAQT